MTEQFVLKFSIVATVLLAVFGIAIGLVSGSFAIVFDGFYSLTDAFMTVEDDDAVMVMRRLARPAAGDPAVVAGESGGVGLAGLIKAAGDPALRAATGLGPQSRVFLINTEGATDPALYRQLVGAPPEAAEMSMA